MKDEEEIRDTIFTLGLQAHGLGILDDLAEYDSDEERTTPDERARELRQIQFLKGALLWASDVYTDQLFEDLHLHLPDASPEGAILGQLPSQFSSAYDLGFAQRFLVASLDLFSGITQVWEPPKCVAEELAFRILLEQVEALEELFNLNLPESWQGICWESLSWEDEDVAYLYDLSMDGIWDPSSPVGGIAGMAPMDFSDWFTVFSGSRLALPPFLRAE